MSKRQKATTKADVTQELYRYRAVFERSAIAVTLADNRLTILRANASAADALGLPQAEIEGRKRWDEFLPADDVKRLAKVLDAEAPGKSEVLRLHTLLQRACGDTKEVVMEAAIVPGDGSIMVSLWDAHDSPHVGDATRQSHEVFRSLFINSPEGIVLIDATGKVEDANPAFVQMFGYGMEDLIGRSLVDLIVPGSLKREATATLRKTLTEGDFLDATTRLRADGREITVSFVGAPVVVQGCPQGAFAIYRDISERQRVQNRLADAFIDLVETTSRLMGSTDPYTDGHQRRVARLADMVGRRLGLDDDTLQGIYVGAMMHDIGKLSVPGSILAKPGKLSKEEWNIIRTHPQRGQAILAEASLPWPVADMALHHHERLDGSGYPHGLGAGALGTEVRILAACDVVEAMSSDRPYRPALPMDEVRKVMHGGRGMIFDNNVVEAIIALVDEGHIEPAHSYDVLTDDRL